MKAQEQYNVFDSEKSDEIYQFFLLLLCKCCYPYLPDKARFVVK